MKLSLRMGIKKINNTLIWVYQFDRRFDTILREWEKKFPNYSFQVDYSHIVRVEGRSKFEGYLYKIRRKDNPYEVEILGKGKVAILKAKNSRDLIQRTLLWFPISILEQLISRRDAIRISIGNQTATLNQLIIFLRYGYGGKSSDDTDLTEIDWEKSEEKEKN